MLREAWDEHTLLNVWTHDSKILLKDGDNTVKSLL